MSDDQPHSSELEPDEGEVEAFLEAVGAKSHPTDRTASEPQQIATDPVIVGNVLYAWQMAVDDAWNVIGITMPTGQTLPLVTTSVRVAWEAFEVAQAHANRNQCQVRLMAFSAGNVMAVVVPND